jgi:hypothetical protein
VGENISYLYIRQRTDNLNIQGEFKKLNSTKINELVKKWETEQNRTFLSGRNPMAKT